MTQNQINYANLKEIQRHNLESEAQGRQSIEETHRHNKATEGETYRSNVAKESENTRHNVTTERETERHNKAGEAYNLADLSEKTRHNKVSEEVSWKSLDETHRHNAATEGLSAQELLERTRHNQETENAALRQWTLDSAKVELDQWYKENQLYQKGLEMQWNAANNYFEIEKNNLKVMASLFKGLEVAGLPIMQNLTNSFSTFAMDELMRYQGVLTELTTNYEFTGGLNNGKQNTQNSQQEGLEEGQTGKDPFAPGQPFYGGGNKEFVL